MQVGSGEYAVPNHVERHDSAAESFGGISSGLWQGEQLAINGPVSVTVSQEAEDAVRRYLELLDDPDARVAPRAPLRYVDKPLTAKVLANRVVQNTSACGSNPFRDLRAKTRCDRCCSRH